MTKSTFTKTKAQIKSYQYYIFWGACTVAVMAGQIFVGAGYQSMSNSVKDLTETITIKMEWDELNRELDRRTIQSPYMICLLYTSPSPRDLYRSRMPSSA